MEALTIGTASHANAPVPVAARRPDVRKNNAPVRMTLCSWTAGRERWRVDALEDRPRLAAALELVLSGEPGVERVEANPLTGRVLVHYRPGLISETVEELIRRALEFGPMTPREYAERLRPSGRLAVAHLLGLEIACTALKITLFGSCWPLALGAAGLLFFHHRRG
jgi:hypothetical protein